MIRLTVQVPVGAPPAQVWAVLADDARDPEWRAGVEEMTPDPPGTAGTGTVTRERIRVAGRVFRNDGEVTGVIPGRRFEWHTTSGARAWGAREVRGHGAGSIARLELNVAPGGIGRAAVPLLRILLARTLRGDAARLRALAEGQRTELALAAGLPSPARRVGHGKPA